jgi:O-antigen/teichoic acid export membrane protein
MIHKNSAEEFAAFEGEQSAASMLVDLGPATTKTVATDDHRRDATWDLAQGPKNYVSLLTAQVASALLSFAAVWLATRLLGSTGYGRVVAIIAASQAIGQLTVNWTAVSLYRYGVEEFVETGSIAKTFWTRFWIFLPNVVLVVATSPLWLPSLSALLKLPPQAYVFILAHFLASSLWVHFQQGLQGAKLMRMQGALMSFERLLIFLVILACFLNGKASFLMVALAYIVAPLGACAVALWHLRRLILPVAGLDTTVLPRMLKFSLPLLPTALVGYMSTNYLDAFFITHYLSAAALGVYAIAYQISGIALQIPLLVGTVLMPLFITLQVDGQLERSGRFMRDVLPLLTLMWGLACAFVAVIGGYAFPLIFGVQFVGLELLLWPLMAAAALVGPLWMGYAPFSNSRSVTYIGMLGAIAAALVNLLLNYWLIPIFGLVGCAWATTAAYGLNMAVVVLLVHWQFPDARTWTMQAVIPMVIGALIASVYADSLKALAATALLSAGLVLVHRKSVTVGFGILRNFQRGGGRESRLKIF